MKQDQQQDETITKAYKQLYYVSLEIRAIAFLYESQSQDPDERPLNARDASQGLARILERLAKQVRRVSNMLDDHRCRSLDDTNREP